MHFIRLSLVGWMVACCALCAACTSSTDPGEEPDPLPPTADTLMVRDTTITIGDTVGVSVYAVNSKRLGGYTLRLEYDSLILGVPLGDTAYAPRQLRGAFEQFGSRLDVPGVITLMAIPGFGAYYTLPIGSGNITRFHFYVKNGVNPGVKSTIRFVDAEYDSNAYNWFVDSLATTQYRPTRIPGTITTGKP